MRIALVILSALVLTSAVSSAEPDVAALQSIGAEVKQAASPRALEGFSFDGAPD